ncbi:MAG: hAT transposon family protein, partial [bacterium]
MSGDGDDDEEEEGLDVIASWVGDTASADGDGAGALDELDLYLNEVVVGPKSLDKIIAQHPPLPWWATMQLKYPMLTRLAARFLASHASTAMLENQFSSAGVNDDAKRHLGQKAQKELFMCCSGKQFLGPIPGTLVQLKSEADLKGRKRVATGGGVG